MNKYRAVKTEVDGIRFDSKAEANYYVALKLLERAGQVSDVELQPVFPLMVNGVKIGVYRADFRYHDAALGYTVTVDVKGYDLPLGKWKRKHSEAQYGIKVLVVKG